MGQLTSRLSANVSHDSQTSLIVNQFLQTESIPQQSQFWSNFKQKMPYAKLLETSLLRFPSLTTSKHISRTEKHKFTRISGINTNNELSEEFATEV